MEVETYLAAQMTESHFKERARLGGYREYAPPDDLRGVAVALWSYARTFDAPPVPGNGHRLLPDTDLSLALERRTDERGVVIDARVVLIGPIGTPKFFAPERGFHLDAIRMHPEWCRDLLGTDPREITDGVYSFAQAAARTMPSRFELLLRTPSPLNALVGIVRELRSGERLSREAMLTHAALASLRRVPSATLGLDRIARSLAVSEVQLRRIVRGSAGFAPKQIQRIRRVDRAIASAERQPAPDWARIAGDNGFYDQPHMIQEFQSIAGCAPAQLFRERRLQNMIEISNPWPPTIWKIS